MTMQVLAVHEFATVRKIIRNYALTEFPQAVTHMASSADTAIDKLARQKYDLVLCALEMAGKDGFEVRKEMIAKGVNRDTPFIIMTATDTESQRRRMLAHGVEHFLVIPFTSLAFRDIVTKVLNLRQRRVHPRFSIPDTKVAIHIGGDVLWGELINFSTNGLLCELVYPEGAANLLGSCKLSIKFSQDYGNAEASDIAGTLMRLYAETWRRDNAPERLRVAWRFVDVPAAARVILEKVEAQAKTELLMTEEAARADSSS